MRTDMVHGCERLVAVCHYRARGRVGILPVRRGRRILALI